MKSPRWWMRAAGCCLLLLSAICALIACPSAQAKAVSDKDVQAAVQTWVRLVPAEARPNAIVERVEPYSVGGMIVAYFAYLADSGFCISGADDMMLPVYLYSPRGAYYPDDQVVQCTLEALLRETKKNQAMISSHDPRLASMQPMFQERREYWSDLIGGTIPPRTLGTYEGPNSLLLPYKSNWQQHSPYNHFCPTVTPGGSDHCVTGCVANAMGGILRYWEWPPAGVGGTVGTSYTRYYTPTTLSASLAFDPHIQNTVTCYGNLTAMGLLWWESGTHQLKMAGHWDADLGNAGGEGGVAKGLPHSDSLAYMAAFYYLWNQLTPSTENLWVTLGVNSYDYAHMNLGPEWGDYQPSEEPVATLLYEVGVALAMTYGACGSTDGHRPWVYYNNFRYDGDISSAYSPDNAVDEDLVIDELQWMRPIDLSCTVCGHDWFVQGYDRTFLPDSLLFFHNQGNADACWAKWDFSLPGSDFLRYIAPQNVVKFVGVGADSAGAGSPKHPYQNIEAAWPAAPDGATLIFKAGSTNTFDATTLTINKPLTLRGYGVTIKRSY